MIYVFDTCSLSNLKHFYPGVFKSVWTGLDELFQDGRLISTKEVWNELQRWNPDQHVYDWLNDRKSLFSTPTASELAIVSQVLRVPHFQGLIGKTQRLKGTPVADPFVIACAKAKDAIVVTEEELKPNAAKIPNACESFGVPCINLSAFMHNEGWSF